MPKITRIYTRTGDDGSTCLGGGQKVSKADIRIETYGTVDELNAHLGVAIAFGLDAGLAGFLATVQNDLFHLGSDLCILEEDKKTRATPGIQPSHVTALEKEIDLYLEETGPIENFILPGGTTAAAHLHVARTVCRRAERLLVELSEKEAVNRTTLHYLNRLSDLLFAMARSENHRKGTRDILWNSRA
jgi:cob(I)alamin adenosyltransferase